MARRIATSTCAVFASAGLAELQPCLRLCRSSDVLAHRRNRNPRLDWSSAGVQNRAVLVADSLAQHRLPCGATHQQKPGVRFAVEFPRSVRHGASRIGGTPPCGAACRSASTKRCPDHYFDCSRKSVKSDRYLQLLQGNQCPVYCQHRSSSDNCDQLARKPRWTSGADNEFTNPLLNPPQRTKSSSTAHPQSTIYRRRRCRTLGRQFGSRQSKAPLLVVR